MLSMLSILATLSLLNGRVDFLSGVNERSEDAGEELRLVFTSGDRDLGREEYAELSKGGGVADL